MILKGLGTVTHGFIYWFEEESPPILPTPPSTIHSGIVAKRLAHPLSVVVTPDGEILLKIKIRK